MDDARLSSAPALRNRQPIAEHLQSLLPERGLVLELASGSGEHVLHFARIFPQIDWQPSDISEPARLSIAAWQEQSGLTNIRPPIVVDACQPENWPIARADALLAINLIHISPWAAARGLFAGAGRILAEGSPVILYGPYFEDKVETVPSNLEFDRWLKARDVEWGVRRREDVEALAAKHGFHLSERHAMPANNLLLVFYRKDD